MPVDSNPVPTAKAQLGCLSVNQGMVVDKNDKFNTSFWIVDARSLMPIQDIYWNVSFSLISLIKNAF